MWDIRCCFCDVPQFLAFDNVEYKRRVFVISDVTFQSLHKLATLVCHEPDTFSCLLVFTQKSPLDGSGIESRWKREFPHLVQTGPGVHPASCTMGNGSVFRGLEWPGRGVYHHLHLAPRLRKEQSYTATPPVVLHSLFWDKFYLQLLPSPPRHCKNFSFHHTSAVANTILLEGNKKNSH